MIAHSKKRLACSARENKGTCDNKRTIPIAEVEERVLDSIRAHLLAPDVVAAAVEAYRAERATLSAARDKARRSAARDLAVIDGKIARLVMAIEDGGDARALVARLDALEAERSAISARAPEPLADNVLALHPNAAGGYRRKVEALRDALGGGAARDEEAVVIVRELISRIVVHPSPDRLPMQLSIEGDLAAMLSEKPERIENFGTASMVPPSRYSRRRPIDVIPFLLTA